MIKVDDIVKIIGPVTFGLKEKELIKIGTLARVLKTDYEVKKPILVKPIYVFSDEGELEFLDSTEEYWYPESSLEEGKLCWSKVTEANENSEERNFEEFIPNKLASKLMDEKENKLNIGDIVQVIGPTYINGNQAFPINLSEIVKIIDIANDKFTNLPIKIRHEGKWWWYPESSLSEPIPFINGEKLTAPYGDKSVLSLQKHLMKNQLDHSVRLKKEDQNQLKIGDKVQVIDDINFSGITGYLTEIDYINSPDRPFCITVQTPYRPFKIWCHESSLQKITDISTDLDKTEKTNRTVIEEAIDDIISDLEESKSDINGIVRDTVIDEDYIDQTLHIIKRKKI